MYKKILLMVLILNLNLLTSKTNEVITNPNNVTALVQSYANKTGKVWVGTPDINLTDGYLRLGNDPAPNEVKRLVLYDANGNQISNTSDGSLVTIPSKFAKALYGNAHLIPLTVKIEQKNMILELPQQVPAVITPAIIDNLIEEKTLGLDIKPVATQAVTKNNNTNNKTKSLAASLSSANIIVKDLKNKQVTDSNSKSNNIKRSPKKK